MQSRFLPLKARRSCELYYMVEGWIFFPLWPVSVADLLLDEMPQRKPNLIWKFWRMGILSMNKTSVSGVF
ncbi:hypothetical protein LguiB_030704 [Lonicera macranthoides]